MKFLMYLVFFIAGLAVGVVATETTWEENYHKIFGYKGEKKCEECGEARGHHTPNCILQKTVK